LGQLSVSPTTLNFGNVTEGKSSSLNGTLTVTGAGVTVASATSSNSQFVLSGLSFPLTLASGQSAAFTVAFTPQSAGAMSGTLTFAVGTSGAAVESLTGTGVLTQHSVSLNWDPSTSSVVGYNVYRGVISGGPYSKINSSVDSTTSFNDGSVASGATYFYVTTAVDSDGTESSYSNQVKAAIPTP
jgi:hypothetical protein